jgi:hypothetical protein
MIFLQFSEGFLQFFESSRLDKDVELTGETKIEAVLNGDRLLGLMTASSCPREENSNDRKHHEEPRAITRGKRLDNNGETAGN